MQPNKYFRKVFYPGRNKNVSLYFHFMDQIVFCLIELKSLLSAENIKSFPSPWQTKVQECIILLILYAWIKEN